MKKYLPFILFGVGLIVVIVAIFVVKSSKNKGNTGEEEEIVTEIPQDKKPFVSLTPTTDGHWLTLKVENIKLDAKSVDYELLYDLPDGRTQGVPGTITLSEDRFERKLLLGSESSGKFRYDEGVEKGTLTFRFRNEKGKLMGKMSDEFKLYQATNELLSADGKFKFIFDKKPKEGFFVVVTTFGSPDKKSLTESPWGIFTSDSSDPSGAVSIQGKTNISLWDGSKWEVLDNGKTPSLGVFIGE